MKSSLSLLQDCCSYDYNIITIPDLSLLICSQVLSLSMQICCTSIPSKGGQNIRPNPIWSDPSRSEKFRVRIGSSGEENPIGWICLNPIGSWLDPKTRSGWDKKKNNYSITHSRTHTVTHYTSALQYTESRTPHNTHTKSVFTNHKTHNNSQRTHTNPHGLTSLTKNKAKYASATAINA